MSSDVLLVRRDDGVCTITLNRPEKLNALNPELMDVFPAEVRKAADDPGVRCVVLTGAGRAFCAGGDVGAMAGRTDGPVASAAGAITDDIHALRRREEVSRLLHEMPKPTIAAVNGYAVGAGLSIALACDIRIAGESARFGTGFARVGFSGDYGGTYFLTSLVGSGRARDLYFTGRVIDAQEALAIGMVNRVVPDADLLSEARALARQIARGPRVAFALMKANLNQALRATLPEMLDMEAERMIITGRTEDHREAARAFVEKREPKFVGR